MILLKKWELTAKQTEKSKIKSHLLRDNFLVTNLFSLSHVHGANIYMFWKRSFILHKLCYNLLVFSITQHIFSPTQHIFISETGSNCIQVFFFFFSPARFFLSLTAYCGHSNQHRHLPALFGLLHIIKNTIIRMDQPAFTQSSWLKNITVWQWTALYNTSFLLDFLFRLGKLIQMRLLG